MNNNKQDLILNNINNLIKELILTSTIKSFIIKLYNKITINNVASSAIHIYDNNIKILDDKIIITMSDIDYEIEISNIKMVFDYTDNIIIYKDNDYYNVVKLTSSVFNNLFAKYNSLFTNIISNVEISNNNNIVEQIINQIDTYMSKEKQSQQIHNARFNVHFISIITNDSIFSEFDFADDNIADITTNNKNAKYILQINSNNNDKS